MDGVQDLEHFLLQSLRQYIKKITHDMAKDSPEFTRSISEVNTVFKNKSTHQRKNLGWLLKEKLLGDLYNKLISYGYIACAYEVFKSHFIDIESSAGKLIWYSQTNKLVYLIDMLMKVKIIPQEDHIHVLISQHFLDRLNKPLKVGTLRALLCQIRNDRMESIDKIIEVLLV